MDVWKAKQQRQITTTNQETHLERVRSQHLSVLLTLRVASRYSGKWNIQEAKNVLVETEWVLSSLERTHLKANSSTYHLGKWP